MSSSHPLRVTWIGLRGFPGVQGGVETHAEQLCPMLQALGCEVRVLARRGYQPESVGSFWRGVKFVSLWAPRRKNLEAVVHTFLSILYASVIERPDVLHIQAIGPALWTMWARMLGLRVVVTHHGPDYDREKWGRFARLMLRAGEASAARFSNEVIVISGVIERALAAKYGVTSVRIPNGLTLQPPVDGSSVLQQFGLIKGRYVLLVSRLVREKRHLDLIEAFRRAALSDWKLVIVGAADHADTYAQEVVSVAARTEGVVTTGFQSGAALHGLYANAGLFVLPSSHEGLPIAILEALSFGVRVVASDIPANLEIGLPAEGYFPLGDVDALAGRLTDEAAIEESVADRAARSKWAAEKFSWERSALATLDVYRRVAA